MARPLLALGGIALIGVGAVAAFGFWSDAEESRDAAVDASIRTVRLDTDSGSVTVRTGGAPSVHQEFDYSFGTPADAYRVDGDTLVLTDCGRWCSADLTVVVPPGTAVEGSADSGDVTLEGVASADVKVDSGGVTARDVTGPFTARADSGRVVGERLGGPVKAHADSGSVDIGLLTAQDVEADADSGDVTVTVPAGSYRVTGESDSGRREITVPTDPNAAHELAVSADSGDVTVRAA